MDLENETKICNVCKIEKQIIFFNLRRDGNTEKPKYRCKECELKYIQKYNKVHIKDTRHRNRKRKDKLKIWFNEKFKNKPCKDCNGIFPPCCMDFDHLDGQIKSRTLATLVGEGYSKEKILEEVSKCDLICANCHRIRTRSRGWNQWTQCKRMKE